MLIEWINHKIETKNIEMMNNKINLDTIASNLFEIEIDIVDKLKSKISRIIDNELEIMKTELTESGKDCQFDTMNEIKKHSNKLVQQHESYKMELY